MKSLQRQKVTIHYANYLEDKNIVDEFGNLTGEKEIVYTEPQQINVSIGAKGGEVSFSIFGSDLDYDSVIVSDNPNCQIADTTILWIDKPINETYDYVVKKINRTLNYVSYAIKKVK